jgi:hypothetical protein
MSGCELSRDVGVLHLWDLVENERFKDVKDTDDEHY